MKGTSKAMALIVAAVMALGTAPVITASAEVAPVVIQAEDMSAFGHYVDQVMTKVDRDEGTQQFNGEYLQQAANGADVFNGWIYDNTTAPSHGETGEGMQVASWGNKYYAIRLRNTSYKEGDKLAENVINEAYYTFRAPYEGEYTLDVYGFTLWSPTLSIYVNGSASPVAVGNLNYYNDGNPGQPIVKQENKATLTLNKGINTIKMTLNSQLAVLDKFELNFIGEIPPEDDTKIKHIELTVQAEELAAIGHFVDDTLIKSEKDAGTQSFAGQYPQQLLGGVDFAAWYYDSSKDITPQHDETGAGAQLASWGNVFYAIKLRGINSTTAGQLKEAYYTVDAPYAGEYTLDIYGYGLWDPTLSFYLNGSSKAIQVGGIDPFSDGSAGHSIIKQETGKIFNLKKGENTIKVTVNKQTAVLDKFVLSTDIEVKGYSVNADDTFLFDGDDKIEKFDIDAGDTVSGFVVLDAGTAGDTADIYLAIYDDNEKLMGIAKESLSTEGKDGQQVNKEISLTAEEGAAFAKMFIFQGGTQVPSFPALCSK